MSAFEAGDRVRVVSLEGSRKDKTIGVAEEMEDMLGNTYEVDYVRHDAVELDGWLFTFEDAELVQE